MAIVTVKSLDGNEIQPYANDLFKQLGIGKKKEDNGVMLLVAPNDRKYWTEVGYGLEPIINDARAGDAGRLMVPYFRKGDYSSGITAAAWQLAKYVADDKGVTLTGVPQLRRAPPANSDDGSGGMFWILESFSSIAFSVSWPAPPEHLGTRRWRWNGHRPIDRCDSRQHGWQRPRRWRVGVAAVAGAVVAEGLADLAGA